MSFMFYVKQQPVTYTLYRSSSSIDEGLQFTITLNTTGVVAGTVVPYTITGIAVEDLVAGSLTGQFVVSGDIHAGTASKVFTVTADSLAEGPETFTMILDNGLASASILINDTSAVELLTPLVVYKLESGTVDGVQNSTLTGTSSLGSINVTSTGNIVLGPESPYAREEGKWSVYFDGSEDYLQTPSTPALAFGLGDFTIEAWINTTYAGHFGILQNSGIYDSGIGKYFFYVGTSGQLGFHRHAGYGGFETAGGVVPSNAWTHVAVVRDSASMRLYANGQKVAESTSSSLMTYDIAQSAHTIGFILTPYWGQGYLSNVRAVKGTALYTSDFAVPTSPLTAIPGTGLLTCVGNRFKDYSSADMEIIGGNNAVISIQSPFDYAPYDPISKGSSATISSAFVNLPSMVGAFGVGDFTVETWIYRLTASASMIADTRPDNGNGSFLTLAVNPNGSIDLTISGAGNLAPTAVNLVPPLSWHHVAITKTAGTVRIFVDGKLVGSTANNTNFSQASYRIGGNAFLGVQSNALFADYRVVHDTALYITDFTLPTSPIGVVPNTAALVSFNDLGIYDGTGKHGTTPVGNARVSTSQFHDELSSVYFDGSGDYLQIPYSSGFNFSVGPWTVEAWVRLNTTAGAQTIISKDTHGSNFDFCIYIANGNSLLCYTHRTTAGFGVSIPPMQPNVWYHIALVRNNAGVNTFYFNGVSMGTNGMTFSNESQVYTTIGSMSWNNPGNFLNGHIDGLTITKSAKYITNFTPI